MAYNDEYEERSQGIDRSAELYDEDLYDADEFGERIDNASMSDDALMDDDLADDRLTANSAAGAHNVDDANTGGKLEDDFGESIAANPHLEDQLEDERLSTEAEADYKEPGQNESLIDKAKDKISDWTNKDR